jgi:hypothetical protein
VREAIISDPSELEALRRENADLREMLAKAAAEAARYRASTNDLLDVVFPYKPLTEEELAEMMKPDEGESLREIIDRFERETAE